MVKSIQLPKSFNAKKTPLTEFSCHTYEKLHLQATPSSMRHVTWYPLKGKNEAGKWHMSLRIRDEIHTPPWIATFTKSDYDRYTYFTYLPIKNMNKESWEQLLQVEMMAKRAYEEKFGQDGYKISPLIRENGYILIKCTNDTGYFVSDGSSYQPTTLDKLAKCSTFHIVYDITGIYRDVAKKTYQLTSRALQIRWEPVIPLDEDTAGDAICLTVFEQTDNASAPQQDSLKPELVHPHPIPSSHWINKVLPMITEHLKDTDSQECDPDEVNSYSSKYIMELMTDLYKRTSGQDPNPMYQFIKPKVKALKERVESRWQGQPVDASDWKEMHEDTLTVQMFELFKIYIKYGVVRNLMRTFGIALSRFQELHNKYAQKWENLEGPNLSIASRMKLYYYASIANRCRRMYMACGVPIPYDMEMHLLLGPGNPIAIPVPGATYNHYRNDIDVIDYVIASTKHVPYSRSSRWVIEQWRYAFDKFSISYEDEHKFKSQPKALEQHREEMLSIMCAAEHRCRHLVGYLKKGIRESRVTDLINRFQGAKDQYIAMLETIDVEEKTPVKEKKKKRKKQPIDSDSDESKKQLIDSDNSSTSVAN